MGSFMKPDLQTRTVRVSTADHCLKRSACSFLLAICQSRSHPDGGKVPLCIRILFLKEYDSFTPLSSGEMPTRMHPAKGSW